VNGYLALNTALDSDWFATFYPSQDVRINFDASLGRRLVPGSNLAFEIGVPIVKDYPVYDFKAKLVLNLKF
jgi:hypothetical protein